MSTKRLFVAIEMPEQVQQEIETIQRHLRAQSLFYGKFIRPDQVHLTLKFIGEVADKNIHNIEQSLKSVTFKKIVCQLGSLDVFERRGFINIIFINLFCTELAQLAHDIEQALVEWVEPEKRDFVSHMTIARVKKVVDKEELLKTVGSFEVPSMTFDVDSFVLMESELTPEGPVYQGIQRYNCLAQTA